MDEQNDDKSISFFPTIKQRKRIDRIIPRDFNMSAKLREALDMILDEAEQEKENQ